MSLASDLNSKEFVGAQNPDDLLHIEFYNHASLDTWVTHETGIKSYKAEFPFIRIAIPGNPNLTVERAADGQDIKRFPRQWLFFQMQTGKIANAENVPGWQLDDWTEIEAEQARQLKYLRFYTVEQIAGCNDAQIQGIGMGGAGLRERAKKALEARNGAAIGSAVKERDDKIAALEEKLERLMAHMEEAGPEPAKRGRKPKVMEAEAV